MEGYLYKLKSQYIDNWWLHWSNSKAWDRRWFVVTAAGGDSNSNNGGGGAANAPLLLNARQGNNDEWTLSYHHRASSPRVHQLPTSHIHELSEGWRAAPAKSRARDELLPTRSGANR
jgi:hypothetical protein